MRLQRLSPILWTKNLQETISFYESILGFNSRRNFSNFASLYKDDIEIMVIEPVNDAEDEHFFSKSFLTGSIYIFMQNVDEFWEAVKDKATIKSPVCDREYMMRDFSIIDNNGYEIVFGEDISKQNDYKAGL